MSAAVSIEYELPPVMTGEDLYDLGSVQRMELVKGQIKIMPPTGFLHGDVELSIGSVLKRFVTQQQLGKAMTGEVGIYTRRNPDTVRGADVLFISHARLQQVKSDSYLDVAPELVIEVLSPRDRWLDVEQKLEEYFAIGVDRVWIADPIRQTLRIYTALNLFTILQGDAVVRDEAILPGFECKVAEFFS